MEAGSAGQQDQEQQHDEGETVVGDPGLDALAQEPLREDPGGVGTVTPRSAPVAPGSPPAAPGESAPGEQSGEGDGNGEGA